MIDYLVQNFWTLWAVLAMVCLVMEMSSGDFYITANLLGVSLHDGSQDVPVTIMITGADGSNCLAVGSYRITVSARTVTGEE